MRLMINESENQLLDFRKYASQLSGGTSDNEIKNIIVSLLIKNNLMGSVLDYGAGKGELAQLLYEQYQYHDITGIDLFEAPAELPEVISWIEQDLNADIVSERNYDLVICSEVIEHLENPRQVFRNIYTLLKKGGTLILTMPNQESIRSIMGLIIGGHFTAFLGKAYPAHITALLRMDLVRICRETGFLEPTFYYSNSGGIPKMPAVKWQTISAGLLKGRYFSDNLIMLVKK